MRPPMTIRKIGQRSLQLIRGIVKPSVVSRKYQIPIPRITRPVMIEAMFESALLGGRQAFDGGGDGGGVAAPVGSVDWVMADIVVAFDSG
jgi:hypothetical protein